MADKSELQKFWAGQIQAAKKRELDWRKKGDTIVKIYREGSKRDKFNILWSNVEILKAATLSKIAPPNVARRHPDEDKTAKDTSEIIERALEFQADEAVFVRNLRKCRDDMLLPGRGTMWYEYDDTREMIEMTRTDLIPQADEFGELIEQEPVFQVSGITQKPSKIENGVGLLEVVMEQRIKPVYVYWKDYLQSDSRSEEDVFWKARRHGLTKDELIILLDTVDIPSKFDPVQVNDEKTEIFEVWEIWSKPNKKRIWFTENALEPLEIEPVPLTLTMFFPCPKPMFPFETTNTMVPVAEYTIYEAQARELNLLVRRLSILTKMMKVSGLYAGQDKDALSDLNDLSDGQFKAVRGEFGSNGGFANSVYQIPLADIATVIDRLENRKVVLKREIFELIGIADIMRGDTQAQETAEAQRIKGSFGTLRLRPRREPVEEFIRDGYEIMAEIFADKFKPPAIFKMTGLQATPQVMQLLKSDVMRTFRIDVETDSTVQPNEEIDRRKAIEFAQAMGGFFAQALPVVQAAPQMAGLVFETIKFITRQFKAGRSMEDEITKTTDMLEKMAEQAQQQASQEQNQDPAQKMEQGKQQIELAKLKLEQQKLAFEAQKFQIENQTTLQVAQINQQTKNLEIVQKREAEQLRSDTTIQKNILDVRASSR